MRLFAEQGWTVFASDCTEELARAAHGSTPGVHPIGLDVHDVGDTTKPMQAGWVMTVEPGIYIPEEGFAVRLEDDVLVTANGPENLMGKIPIEPDEIEDLMHR